MIQPFKKRIQTWNAIRELKKYAPLLRQDSQGLGAEDLIALLYGEKWQRFFWIKQVRSEITALCKIIAQQKPKTVLEIGTANGGSLFLNTKLAHPEALIISLDLPGGRFGGGYPAFKEDFYRSFATQGQKIALLRADSHHPDSLKKVKDILEGRPVDFLFIDGDHTYEGVKADYTLYSPLVAQNGIIAFHDIAPHPPEWNVQVDKFWDEVKLGQNYQEIIENPAQGWAGIGVLFK
ncbi:MAG: hypothetical protein OHK0053_24810 [Microscillaceae bacterium]